MAAPQRQNLRISLVIPIRNEIDSLSLLIKSINGQTRPPDEIILVDGGSTDDTVKLALQLTENDARYRVLKIGEPTPPGRGRNIGAENAQNEWIAFTDAGIKLENTWLEKLVEVISENPDFDVVYGNYAPVRNTFFEKCAVFAYVPSQNKEVIRGKFIASSIMKKNVWQAVGGFPDFRAAEDLMFMDKIEEQGFNIGFAPKAVVHWYLRPDLLSTFRKFVLYSKHNVWAKRQWQWHYGVAKQYLLLLPFIILTLLHTWWWLIAVGCWVFARTIKRMLTHRYEFNFLVFLNPLIFLGTTILILTIDLATFVGWIKAIYQKKSDNFTEIHA